MRKKVTEFQVLLEFEKNRRIVGVKFLYTEQEYSRLNVKEASDVLLHDGKSGNCGAQYESSKRPYLLFGCFRSARFYRAFQGCEDWKTTI